MAEYTHQDGTARLLDGKAPSLSGSGRLEVFHAGAWGSYREQKVEGRKQIVEGTGQISESREQRAETREQRAEAQCVVRVSVGEVLLWPASPWGTTAWFHQRLAGAAGRIAALSLRHCLL